MKLMKLSLKSSITAMFPSLGNEFTVPGVVLTPGDTILLYSHLVGKKSLGRDILVVVSTHV